MTRDPRDRRRSPTPPSRSRYGSASPWPRRSSAAHPRALKILLICPWVVKLGALQVSLRAHGLTPDIVRVDFEAALRAALLHHVVDAVFYVETPSLARESAAALILAQAPKLSLTC